MRYVLGGIDKVRDGYVALVRRLVRVAFIGIVVVRSCSPRRSAVVRRLAAEFFAG